MEERETKHSLLLSKQMDLDRNGIFTTKLKRTNVLMGEFTEKYFIGRDSIPCGSQAEGTVLTAASDSDIMGILPRVLVMQSADETVTDVRQVVMITDSCLPGYVMLQPQLEPFKFESQVPDSSIWLSDSIIYHKLHGKLLISSKAFNQVSSVAIAVPGDSFDKTGVTTKGPAKNNKTLLTDVDYVYALECNQWPDSAIKWLQRKRLNNWPSSELLDTLSKETKCFIVPTGDKLSEDFEIQWRLSFAAIERELIWNMNATQLKCFILLKTLLKKYISPEHPDQITTYHMKNITFWLFENMKADVWREDNLIQCVRKGLLKLQECIKAHNLPQFIIPENNLFRNVLNSENEQESALKAVTDVYSKILEYLKLSLPEETILNSYQNNLNKIQSLLMIHAYYSMSRKICYFSSGVKVSKLSSYFKDFRKRFGNKIEMYLPSVMLAIGKAIYRDMVNGKRGSRRALLLNESIEEIKKSADGDMLSSPLHIAMVYINEQKYELARDVLETSIPKEGVFLYIGGESGSCYHEFPGGYNANSKTNICVNGIQEERYKLLLDVTFAEGDFGLIPDPLKLELKLKGCGFFLCIHPVVIAYFLRFLSEHHMGLVAERETTLMLLSSAVMNTQQHKSLYAHINILGYCYSLIGKREMAFHIFGLSLRTVPSVINAAAYMLAFIVNDVTKEKKN